jgi:branched-chain amino acid transport system permease protein
MSRYTTWSSTRSSNYLPLAQGGTSWRDNGGLVSLAPAASVGLGGYAAAVLAYTWVCPMPLLILAGGILAQYSPLSSVCPMFRFRGLYFTIATLVLAEALRLFMINWGVLGGAKGLFLPQYAPTERTLYCYVLGLAIATSLIGRHGVAPARWDSAYARCATRGHRSGDGGLDVPHQVVGVRAYLVLLGLLGAIQMFKLGVIEPYGASLSTGPSTWSPRLSSAVWAPSSDPHPPPPPPPPSPMSVTASPLGSGRRSPAIQNYTWPSQV